ncbi:MAG: 1-deoxy-D-xylulose-5-phosphate reductoisomerase [Candidatus Omnitrophota bacterium]|jgi:1-deoxy-D-xylulose-5-phosphate reductoisomerase|nr:MAG: 1-deoxy-D-xylulose-5-phosphate reductoisomerase [Candidatus Omnitrophota bacterium]
MKNIAIIGSTGSIGRNALEVIEDNKKRFRVVALSANSNIELLSAQARRFCPPMVCVTDISCGAKCRQMFKKHTKIFLGQEGLEAMVADSSIDKVLLAVSGTAALVPFLHALDAGKEIALANKEALVMAGSLIMRKAKARKATIIPVDSEQSAIWQCLDGNDKEKLKQIYLTASGGPFLKFRKNQLARITVAQTLQHPRWKMGKKVTVDSATLMNKGLEVLEAMYLFGVGAEKIKILIHPEAIIHSMVEFVDGITIAQLSATDMRIPIQYAFSYPERLANRFGCVDFYAIKSLNFEKPDTKRFPCINLAYRAASEEGTLPCVMNAANEVSVEAFLRGEIAFTSIYKVIDKVMDNHRITRRPSLGDIIESDAWAKRRARLLIQRAR